MLEVEGKGGGFKGSIAKIDSFAVAVSSEDGIGFERDDAAVDLGFDGLPGFLGELGMIEKAELFTEIGGRGAGGKEGGFPKKGS